MKSAFDQANLVATQQAVDSFAALLEVADNQAADNGSGIGSITSSENGDEIDEGALIAQLSELTSIRVGLLRAVFSGEDYSQKLESLKDLANNAFVKKIKVILSTEIKQINSQHDYATLANINFLNSGDANYQAQILAVAKTLCDKISEINGFENYLASQPADVESLVFDIATALQKKEALAFQQNIWKTRSEQQNPEVVSVIKQGGSDQATEEKILNDLVSILKKEDLLSTTPSGDAITASDDKKTFTTKLAVRDITEPVEIKVELIESAASANRLRTRYPPPEPGRRHEDGSYMFGEREDDDGRRCPRKRRREDDEGEDGYDRERARRRRRRSYDDNRVSHDAESDGNHVQDAAERFDAPVEMRRRRPSTADQYKASSFGHFDDEQVQEWQPRDEQPPPFDGFVEEAPAKTDHMRDQQQPSIDQTVQPTMPPPPPHPAVSSSPPPMMGFQSDFSARPADLFAASALSMWSSCQSPASNHFNHSY